MTERQATKEFETRFGGLVRTYTDAATRRRIDPLAISRTVIATRPANGWWSRRLGVVFTRARFAGLPWAVAVIALVLIGIVGAGVLGRPPASPTPGPVPTGVPDALRHSWQRPLPVVPGGDQWGTGFLKLAEGVADFGPEPGSGASTSTVMAAGSETLVLTATAGTKGCAIGDVGAYGWSLAGKDTVLALAAIRPDACAARELALAGQWVRSDLQPAGQGGLPAGTYLTGTFDPFGDPSTPMRLMYTIPQGWDVIDEGETVTIVGHHQAEVSPGGPPSDSFILVMGQPRIAAAQRPGTACDPALVLDAPGVGSSLDALVAAIRGRPGVVSTTPAPIAIGGHEGSLLDLQLAASWTGGCVAPEGPVVGVVILHEAGSATGPIVGLAPDKPLRLILVRLTSDQTMAIAIYDAGSSSSAFEAHLGDVMPVVKSFEFRSPPPKEP